MVAAFQPSLEQISESTQEIQLIYLFVLLILVILLFSEIFLAYLL